MKTLPGEHLMGRVMVILFAVIGLMLAFDLHDIETRLSALEEAERTRATREEIVDRAARPAYMDSLLNAILEEYSLPDSTDALHPSTWDTLRVHG